MGKERERKEKGEREVLPQYRRLCALFPKPLPPNDIV